MKVAVFSSKPYDHNFLEAAGRRFHQDLSFFSPRLTLETTPLAAGYPAVCAFVQDELNRAVLEALVAGGTRLVALRSAGFNNVDIAAAADLGMSVVRVPAYSPHAVAEHAVAMILTLNRKIHRAYARVREGNFSLEGLLGFDLFGRTVGILGTGQIGTVVAQIMHGFGCRLLAYDVVPNALCKALGVEYCPLDQLLSQADIITLHCPLTPQTHHLVDYQAIDRMKPGVMLINTSRGAVVDQAALVAALQSGGLAGAGLDVLDPEPPDAADPLLHLPNLVFTPHTAGQADEVWPRIVRACFSNIERVARGEPPLHLARPLD